MEISFNLVKLPKELNTINKTISNKGDDGNTTK